MKSWADWKNLRFASQAAHEEVDIEVWAGNSFEACGDVLVAYQDAKKYNCKFKNLEN